MAHAKLTALEVERAHRSGKRLLLGDGDGLYLRKQASDGAFLGLEIPSWRQGALAHVGQLSDMLLAMARIEARQARAARQAARPHAYTRRAAKAEERQRGVPFKELCEDWFHAEVEGRGIKHPAVPRRYLDKYQYLLPKLGRMAAVDVTPSDIARD